MRLSDVNTPDMPLRMPERQGMHRNAECTYCDGSRGILVLAPMTLPYHIVAPEDIRRFPHQRTTRGWGAPGQRSTPEGSGLLAAWRDLDSSKQMGEAGRAWDRLRLRRPARRNGEWYCHSKINVQ